MTPSGIKPTTFQLVAQCPYFWCVQWFSYKITKWLCQMCKSYYSHYDMFHITVKCRTYGMYTHCSILYLVPGRLTVFENRIIKVFYSWGKKQQQGRQHCVMTSFVIRTSPILLGWSRISLRCAHHAEHMQQKSNACKALVTKPEQTSNNTKVLMEGY